MTVTLASLRFARQICRAHESTARAAPKKIRFLPGGNS